METLSEITAGIFLLISLVTGCPNDEISENCDGDNAESIETFYSDEIESIECHLQNIADQKEVNLVITHQEDFEKYFSCNDQLPAINFEEYFILAGRYEHHQCAVFDSQTISVCNNRITYKVEMLEQDCQAITTVFYAIALEKKYNNLLVNFKVQFKN